MSAVSSRYSNGPLNQNPPGEDPGSLLKRNSGVKRQNAVKRHSLSMGDNYVEIIGKFDPSATAQHTAPVADTYVPTKPSVAANDNHVDVLEDGSPVVAELRTNVIVSWVGHEVLRSCV